MPNVDENHSMAQFIANSIKVELNEPEAERIGRDEKQIGSECDAETAEIKKSNHSTASKAKNQ